MIAVIVLNWNNGPDTIECLESVYRSDHPNYKVYLVDNGSIDGSLEKITGAYPQAKVIQNGANLGFAEGNNRGIEQALQEGADYVFLLNNDATVRSDTLSLLEKAAIDHPQAAVVGPKIYYYDHPTQIWYGGAGFSPKSASFYHVDWGVEEIEAPKRSTGPTGYICGCAFFAKAAVLKQVGLMDPRYFLNWEEIDWCYRFQQQGYTCIYVPTAKVWHKIGSSFIGGKRGPMWLYYYWRNRFLWLESHIPFRPRIQMFVRILPQMTALIPQLFQSEKKAEAAASLRGIADYVFRRFGQGPTFR